MTGFMFKPRRGIGHKYEVRRDGKLLGTVERHQPNARCTVQHWSFMAFDGTFNSDFRTRGDAAETMARYLDGKKDVTP